MRQQLFRATTTITDKQEVNKWLCVGAFSRSRSSFCSRLRTVKTSQPAGTWQLISDQRIWRQSVLIRAIMCVQAAGMNTEHTLQTHTHTHTIHTGSALSLLQGHPHCSTHACAVCVVSAEAVKQRQYYVNSALMDSTKSCQVWETVGVCVCVCLHLCILVSSCVCVCVCVCVLTQVCDRTLHLLKFTEIWGKQLFFLVKWV